MSIERSILDAASRMRRNREPHLIATVVRVQGSAYRRPGARMLLTQFRWISGAVSGGTFDGDLASRAWRQTRNGEPLVVQFDSRAPNTGIDDEMRSAFGLGCQGVVEIMFERAAQPGKIDPLELAERCIREQRRAAIVTVIRSEVPGISAGKRVAVIERSEVLGAPFDPALRAGMIADARSAIATGESCNRTYRSDQGNVDVFVEAILPPPRLFVFGTGHDAVPLVTLAKTLGWDVAICAPRARVSVRQRLGHADELLVGSPAELAARVDQAARAIAVVMNHDYETDTQHLSALLASHVQYIGVLGPRSRSTRMLTELGLGLVSDARVHAPVGLELGAETPQEVALAIVAEVQATLARVPAQSLRDHIGPVHQRAPMPRIAEAVAAATVDIPIERPAQAAS